MFGDSFLRDVGYLTSDVLTGKSLPVLAAIAMRPLDPALLGTTLVIGVFGGSCVTLAYAWSPAAPGGLTWLVRFLNLFYSAWLSMSFALHVVVRVGGGAAWLVPAFCVVMQAVPERQSTLVVLGFLSWCLFYLSVFETAGFWMSGAGLAFQMRPATKGSMGQEVLVSLGHSLVVLVLTVYATVCHGPVTSVAAQTQRYTSYEFLSNPVYGVGVCAMAGLTRAYTYWATALLQDHALHMLLDGSDGRPEPWTAWLYLVTLVYSATWACTQFTEQVLTALQGDKTDMRARATALLFILAYWHRWRGTWVFWSTIGMCLLTLGSLAAASITREAARKGVLL